MEDFYIFLFSKVASTEVFVAIVVLVCLFFIIKKQTGKGIALALGAAGMGLTVWGLKMLIAMPRLPEPLINATGYAFPSGHAAASTFLCVLTLGYVSHIKNPLQRVGLSAVAAGLTLAICASRVVYNVHTPLQVIAGFLIGLLWGMATYACMKRFGAR